MRLPFRLVYHFALPQGVCAAHADLFLRSNSDVAAPLLTYELSIGEKVAREWQQIARNLTIDVVEAEIIHYCAQDSYSIVRKIDHRALYWSYSGPIDGQRGTIEEICRGWASIESERLGGEQLYFGWKSRFFLF